MRTKITAGVVAILVSSGFAAAVSPPRQAADADITKWGLAVDAGADEYYNGLMERVIDGPQAASWAPGLTVAMNLRGQKVDMLVKPTTSVYAPFFLSSRGYAAFVKGTWPGVF